MCLYPKFLDKENKRPTLAQSLSRIRVVVPCGKCVECLKQRQSNFATRIYLEARKGAKMFFVTFTYSNDALPLAMRVLRVRKDSGEIDEISPYNILDKDVADNFREYIVSQPSTKDARYYHHVICDFDDYEWIAQITPSLNRKDIRNWLKKRRIQYEREFGEKLPDFTYAFCGEYGPRGGRPHYHALFMGLSHEQLSWMLADWNIQKGYTLTKEIPILNPDGTDARLIVSRYVGKYIAKGKFDIDSCLNCDCEKGRLCNSLGLGNSLTQEEIAYYRAYDLFGEYDIDTFYQSDGNFLRQEQIDCVVREVERRCHLVFGINGKNGKPIQLAMPMYLKKKLFCVRDSYEQWVNYYDYENDTWKKRKEIKVRYVGSVLSSKVASFKRGQFVLRNFCEYKKIRSDLDLSEVSIETYFELLSYSKSIGRHSKETLQEINVQRQYFSNERDNQ